MTSSSSSSSSSSYPKHNGFYRPDIAVRRRKTANASMIDDGILLPGWDCQNPECGAFTGTAREDLKVCRCCGMPRPDDGARAYVRSVKEHLDHPVTGQHLRAVYENLSATQDHCNKLLNENRELKLRVAHAEEVIEILLNEAVKRTGA
jgi:hypothetical protein